MAGIKGRSSSKAKKTAKKRGERGRQWLPNLSIRSNQDNQREYEETLTRQMVNTLTRRTCGRNTTRMSRSTNGHAGHSSAQNSIWNNHIVPIGGTYVRMEQEWRDAVSRRRFGGSRVRQTSRNSISARPRKA